MVKSGYLVSNDRGDIVNQWEKLSFNVPISRASSNNVKEIRKIEVTNKEAINDLASNDIPEENREQLYPDNESFYIDPESAKKYYDEAREFKDWVNGNLKWVTINMAMRNNKELNKVSDTNGDFNSDDKVFDFSNNDPEDPNSAFSEHKTNVIKYAVQDSLKQAITAYSQGSTVSYDFKLPKLDITEWNMVSSNICMLTFMQGLPCGTKYYNNYALVTSGTNKLYKTQDNLYFMPNNDIDKYYHKIDCTHIGDGVKYTELVGYPAIDYEIKRVKIGNDYKYYGRHRKWACYYCIISSNYEKDENWEDDPVKSKAYYTAMAREKYNQYKSTENLNYDENAQAN